MILKRLFGGRWRGAGGAEPGVAAGADAGPARRRQACKETRDLSGLLQAAREDTDAGVRDLAAARLRRLLEGGDPEAPDLAERSRVLEELTDPSLLAHLARHAREPELRLLALVRVGDPEVLADSCLQDTVAAVRLAAVRRLQDKASLERVGRGLGRRDKNVYREVRQKLRQIADREQQPARVRAGAEALCERVERLGRTGTWSQDRAVLELADGQWAELGPALPPELAARFGAARERFLAAWERHREADLARQREQRDLTRARTAGAELLQQLETLAEDAGTADPAARLAALEAARESLPSLPDGDQARFARDWERLAGTVRAQLERRHELSHREQELERLLEQGAHWLDGARPLAPAALQEWLRQGRALAALVPGDALERRYAELCGQLQARQERQAVQAAEKIEQLPERLWLLEQELEQGGLRQASALHQSIQADLDLLQAGAGRDDRLPGLRQRFRRITPRLRELQSWRKWGADQQRQELTEAMEALAGEELPPEERLDRVQALQARWKQTDRGGTPVNEALWQRFHQAGEQAYARCRPFLEEQARVRAASLQAREAICQELETFLDQADWERVDWKRAVQAEREVRAAWAAAGPVEPRRRKAIDRRYRAAMKRLSGELAAERTRNRAFRQDLIGQARALAGEPDLALAAAAVRRLQQAWQTTVPGKRSQENQLWEDFRAACDQVFERRREADRSQRQELDENARVCRGLCAELEALAGADDPQRLRQGLAELSGRWEASLAQDLARPDEARLQRRWEAAGAGLQQRLGQLQRAAERAGLERLRSRAALCAELEAALAAGGAEPEPDWASRWQALPAVTDPAWSAAIGARWQAALDALGDPGRLDTGGQARREALCLEMELLAGLDSPPEAAEQRLAFQVSRLAGRLAEGSGDRLAEAPAVEAQWYLAAPAPAPLAAALEARFERARSAWLAAGPDQDPQAPADSPAR
jgi:exonuclease SbcC